MADLTKIEEHITEADWDDPANEVGGEMIDTNLPHDPECTADCCSDAGSADTEDEECEQDSLCYECDQPHEDCECEPDDCEDCGLHHDVCECDTEDVTCERWEEGDDEI